MKDFRLKIRMKSGKCPAIFSGLKGEEASSTNLAIIFANIPEQMQ